MTSLNEFNRYGEEIEKLVLLRTFPIAVKMIEEKKFGYRHHAFLEMRPDFPRPDFYKKLFRECGLDADDIPTWPIS